MRRQLGIQVDRGMVRDNWRLGSPAKVFSMSLAANSPEGPRLRLEFWRDFTAYMTQASSVRCCRASTDTWMAHGGDINFGSLFTICRTRIGEIGAQFALESVAAKSIFYFLASKAPVISQAFETQLLWRSPAATQTSLIEVRRNADIESLDQWPEHFAWLRSQLESLQNSLWPLLGRVPSKGEPRIWDESSFTEELSRYNPWSLDIFRLMLDWSKDSTSAIRWGRGQRRGTFSPGFRLEGHEYHPVAFSSDGTFAINLPALAKEAPFNLELARLELLRRLNQLPYLSLPPKVLETRASLPLAILDSELSRRSFFQWMDWIRSCVMSKRVL